MILRSLKELRNYVLRALDGEIGKCKDFLFDDQMWTVRYMVADTGKWLPGQKVLISPIALGDPDWEMERFPIRLTKRQIEGAPDLDTDAPVNRQYEIRWNQYYRWPNYWAGTHAWGIRDHPELLYQPAEDLEENEPSESHVEQSSDEHLRSVVEVTDYHIRASDGDIGRVKDFIVDDDIWTIRYMVVSTGTWLPGRKVLIPPEWVDSVNWRESKVGVELTKEQVKNSPEYDPSMPVNRKYEIALYDFYGRPKYWQ